MKFKWSHLLVLAMMAAALVFVAGCGDDDDDNGGNNPQPNPLIGEWNGVQGVDSVGAEELFFDFNADSTYLFRSRFDAIIVDERGTWHSTTDSVYLHVETVDNVPADTTYAVWYDFQPGEDTLRVRHVYDDVYEVWYARD